MKIQFNYLISFILLLGIILSAENSIAQQYVYNCNAPFGKKQYKYSDSFSNYDIQVKGDIKVNDEDTGIRSISKGGYLKFSKKTFGNKRSILVESDSNGQLHYEYYEGRKEVPFDPEGRKWLAEVLIEVIHMTGIDADGRTQRIYTGRGVDGVIEEISLIPSNSVMALYFESLLDNFKLSEDELLATSYAIASEMSSNTERGKLYREYSELFLSNNTTAIGYFNSLGNLSSNTERGSILTSISRKIDFDNPQVTEAYFGSIDKMSSNTERGRVLRYAESTQELSNNAYTRLLVSVKKLSSNTEMGIVIRSLKDLDINNEDLSDAYFNAIDAMSSNTEAGVTLRKLIKSYNLNDKNYTRLLSSVKKLSSNTEKGSVLRSIQELNMESPEVAEAYFLSVRSLTSNTEMGSVLRYTMRTYALSTETWMQLFNTASKLSSNTEMGYVLSDGADEMPYDNEKVVDAFFISTNKFSSSTEHGRVLKAVISNPAFNKYTAYKVLESARKISSSTEKGSVLIALSNTEIIKDPEIRKLYKSTAQTISSDYDYRRVMDKIFE